MTNITHGDFQPGDRIRVKNNVLLDGGTHQGQQGTVDHLGTFYVYVTIPTSDAALPLVAEEIEHAATPLTRDDIDALPVGAVIVDRDGDTYERTTDVRWTRTPSSKWGLMHTQPNWDHITVRALPDNGYAPVTLVSSPTVEPEQAPDLTVRLAALDAEIEGAKDSIRTAQGALDARRRDLNRKATLAAQYRAVLADLEAQK